MELSASSRPRCGTLAAVRDVGCDVVPEDLIDAEFGGAGNVITDLLDGSGQWDTTVAEWLSGNRAVDRTTTGARAAPAASW